MYISTGALFIILAIVMLCVKKPAEPKEEVSFTKWVIGLLGLLGIGIGGLLLGCAVIAFFGLIIFGAFHGCGSLAHCGAGTIWLVIAGILVVCLPIGISCKKSSDAARAKREASRAEVDKRYEEERRNIPRTDITKLTREQFRKFYLRATEKRRFSFINNEVETSPREVLEIYYLLDDPGKLLEIYNNLEKSAKPSVLGSKNSTRDKLDEQIIQELTQERKVQEAQALEEQKAWDECNKRANKILLVVGVSFAITMGGFYLLICLI